MVHESVEVESRAAAVGGRWLSPVAGLLAAALLFTNLGARHLWQDEAACAVLALRLLEHGRPLAYDGQDLITMDEYRPEEEGDLPRRTGEAREAVAYFAGKGDFKSDTTWIGQPWGQFVLAAVPLALLGNSAFAARLLFALCGVAAAVALVELVRRRLRDPWTAALAGLLLLGNTFWFLHMRQARYYAPSSLFLLLTLAAWLRWQDGRRWGATAFVAAAWCWFQFDFGSLWPVLALFGAAALLAAPARWRATVTTFTVLGLLLLPFVLFYELGSRYKEPFVPFEHRLLITAFNVNAYQLPLLVLPLLLLLARAGRLARPGEARLVALCAAIVVAVPLFMTAVGPEGFYRYVVGLTPLSCLLVALAVVRACEWLGEGRARPLLVRALAALSVGGVLLTPVPSVPGAMLLPKSGWTHDPLELGLRPEFAAGLGELLAEGLDPNRAAVDFLRPRLQPGDEVLVNYEDIPLMFALDCPVRGGIPAFRVDDPTAPPPRFVVFRRAAAAFTFADAFLDVIGRHEWRVHELLAPDIPWGNNPDPTGHWVRYGQSGQRVLVLERVSGSAE